MKIRQLPISRSKPMSYSLSYLIDARKSRHLMIPFGRNPRFVGREDEPQIRRFGLHARQCKKARRYRARSSWEDPGSSRASLPCSRQRP